MLTPEQLQNLPQELTDLYGQLSEFILRDIARRIAKGAQITDTAEYQMYRARSLGLSTDEIAEKIAEINGSSAAEINRLIREAAAQSDEFDRKMLGADKGAAILSLYAMKAVREAQSENGDGSRPAQPVHAETRIDLKVDAYLPAEYVSGDVQRMEVYKRISLIRTREDREDVIEELIDRFGEPPAPVMRLIDIAQLRALLSPLGVSRVTFTAGTLILRVEPSLLPPTDRLLEAMTRTDKRLLLSAAREPSMLLRDKNLTAESALIAAVPLFERLNKLIFTKEKPNA